MADWPATLPQSLLLDGYSEVQQDGRLRSSMDAGPDFVRQRFSAVPTAYAGMLVLTDAQTVTLRSFYSTTLYGGAASFNWHPRGLHQASPQTILDMRFLAPPTYRSIGRGLWQVDISMESLP